ncbi:MAG: MarR family transcriptional regulator [Phenylobacterium sp.]|uniref:MarR family winged helix-turn-helix transcriptional regulator n=1 Tax=Phenylobacterium sp. TaxID=1871053 RepID=UPI003BB80533
MALEKGMIDPTSPARPSVDECNCNALRKAARRVSQFYDSRLKSTGLRISQFTILVIIWESESISVNELASRLELDRTTTGKNLRPLERAGLIAIAASPLDRRSKAVQLTPKGEQVLKDAAPLWREAQKDFAELNGTLATEEIRTRVLDLKVGDFER